MKGRVQIFYHYYRECLLLSSPAAVFVGAAALLKSWEKKNNKLLLSGFNSCSARLQPISQIQLFQDNCGGMILFQIKKLHENLL